MIVLNKESRVNAVIPDNNKTGLTDTIRIFTNGKINDINVDVDISHKYIGDIHAQLTSPSGKVVVLHNRKGGSSDNLVKKFSAEELKTLIGERANGLWTMAVKDFSPRDQGTLNSWSINMVCDEKANTKSEIEIPDKDPIGLTSKQAFPYSGVVKSLKLSVDIAHGYIGDLSVKLIAPSGKSVIVHNRQGGDKKNLKATYGKEALADMIGESTKGNWDLQIKDFAPKDSGVLRKWKLDFRMQPKDDLKKVEGIGPKIEGLINAAGIHTFSALSKTSEGVLRTILAGGGDRYKMHNPGSWPKQAGLAANGEWDKLDKLQDELIGGR